MLIYARVGLILTPTTPPHSAPPLHGYLFPELRYISLVLISRANITFFHYTGRVPDQITTPDTSDARSRNSAPRDYVSEVGRFQIETD